MNMKLRNLLFGTMIACAFASCSNDDDPINNIDGETPVGKNEAVLVVQTAGLQSKAVVDVTGENTLATTSVIVFNGTGDGAEIEAVGEANTGSAETKSIKLTPGNKMVLVLANVNAKDLGFVIGASYGSLKDKTIDFGTYEGANLSMNSAVYKVSLAAGKKNYLGYAGTTDATKQYLKNTGEAPVYLYHNVAKVSLNSIIVENKKGADKTQYPNPELKVKSVFVIQAHKNSKLFTEGAWGATNVTDSYLNAVTNTEYASTWVAQMSGVKEKVFSYLERGYENDGYAVVPFGSGISLGFDTDGHNYASWSDSNNKTFYVYENDADGADKGDIYTLLVVKGDFSYDGLNDAGTAKERHTDYDKYYPVAIGVMKDGYTLPSGVVGLDPALRGGTAETKYTGVIRNIQYRVNMTVSGPGYNTPFGPVPADNTFLFTNVEVVEFGAVNQDASFE